MTTWIDIKKRKPRNGQRVLVCDDNGDVALELVGSVHNIYVGKITWRQSYFYGNTANIVAWMPLPKAYKLK